MIHDVIVTQRIGLYTTASLIFANADVGVECERALQVSLYSGRKKIMLSLHAIVL